MTEEQNRNLYEYLKGNTYSKDYFVDYLYNGISHKCDCLGDIRLVIIPAHVEFKNEYIGCFNLLLKPKKNEISWEPKFNCKAKYPMECLKVFEQFGLKVIDNDTLRNTILDK